MDADKEDLLASDFFQGFQRVLRSHVERPEVGIKRVVCLGIGQFTRSVEARHQLAFLLAILDNVLDLPPEKATLYDPALSRLEVELLRSTALASKLHLAPDNREGCYQSCHNKTLFYLPHCAKQLTNNLLWCNWSSSRLGSLLLLGNSIGRLVSSQPDRLLRQEGVEYMLRASQIVRETPVDNCYRFPDIFNDTALHSFPDPLVTTPPPEEAPPSYPEDDLEFVRSS